MDVVDRSAANELYFLTIAEAATLIAARKLSSVELTQAYLDRIGQLDDQLRAFITVTGERALEMARHADRASGKGDSRGPLHGIPFALKDIYATAGILTTGHSKIDIDNVPSRNATTVQRLYDAGAVLLGKLATHEFASGGPALDLPWPPARNPWNTAYFTGGSSSGSAAAVAAGFAPAALGTDTGGSIRGPAALCGVAGIKPTYGRVSRHGVVPNSFSLDHCGPLAWTVEDCAIVLQHIAGHDPNDPASARREVPDYRRALTGDIRGLRIGLIRHYWEDEEPIHPETRAAIERAIQVFRDLGASTADVRLATRQEYNDVKLVIAKAEILAIHEKELRERPGDFCMDFLGRNLPGCLFSATDYVRAQRERRRMIDDLKPVFEKFDVLLTVGSTPAGRLDALVGKSSAERWESSNIYNPFNVTGLPALMVCNGYSEQGLPLSMQIVGRPFDETTVFRAGHAYERVTQWRSRRPVLRPGLKVQPLEPPVESTAGSTVDESVRQLVAQAVQRAGFKLNAAQMQMLCALAPPALASVDRVRRARPREDEPAAVFGYGDEW
jgi:aspartyl-tRNA(Asn)/glutamyl-tRNA(Gln) amidotransferase subunit A